MQRKKIDNVYPFTAIVGQEKMKEAIVLNLINPGTEGNCQDDCRPCNPEPNAEAENRGDSCKCNRGSCCRNDQY